MKYNPSEPLEQPCVVVDSRNSQLFDDFNIDTAAITDRLARQGVYASDIGCLSIFARFDEIDPDGQTVAADYDQGHIMLHTPAIVSAGISTYTADVLRADHLRRKQPYFSLDQHVETAFDQALNNTLQRAADDLSPQAQQATVGQQQRLQRSRRRWEHIQDGHELVGMVLGAMTALTCITLWDRSFIETAVDGGLATYVGDNLSLFASKKRMQIVAKQLALLSDPEARAIAAEDMRRGLFNIEVSSAITERAQSYVQLERSLQ
jgi:hypothetical protein